MFRNDLRTRKIYNKKGTGKLFLENRYGTKMEVTRAKIDPLRYTVFTGALFFYYFGIKKLDSKSSISS